MLAMTSETLDKAQTAGFTTKSRLIAYNRQKTRPTQELQKR